VFVVYADTKKLIYNINRYFILMNYQLRWKSKDKSKIWVTILLVATVVAVLTSPVMAEETEVARSFSTTSPGPNSEFTVTLSISDIQVGFIDETIPNDFAFTEHPSDYQYYEVSGQRIAFAVVDEITEIRYKVVAPSSGDGTFSGVWEDLSNKINGTITSNSISVADPGDGDFVSSTPTSTPVAIVTSGEEKVEASPVLTPESEETSELEETETSGYEETEASEPEKGAPAPISTPHKDTDIGLIMMVAAIIVLIVGIVTFAVFRSRRK
jgi:hypothetical protein